MLRFALLLLSLVPVLAMASDAIICQEEARSIQNLSNDNEHLGEQVSSLRSLNRGTMIDALELHQLLDLRLVNASTLAERRMRFRNEKNEKIQFEKPLCEASTEHFERLQQTHERLHAEYLRLMAQLLSLPDANIISLTNLQSTQVRLLKSFQLFKKKIADKNPSSDLVNAANTATQNLTEQTEKLFSAFLIVEKPDISTLTPHADVMSLELELPTSDTDLQSEIADFQEALYRTRIDLTHLRATLHDMVWSKMSPLVLWSSDSIARMPELLARELHLFIWNIEQTLLETQLDVRRSDSIFSYSMAIMILTVLISGCLLIAAMVFIAKKLERLLFWCCDRFFSKSKLRSLRRIESTFRHYVPVTPWLVLWLSLSGIEHILNQQQWYAMLWVMPLLELIILMGILVIFFDWLMFRIASSSGSFLNSDQSQDLHRTILINVILMTAPWAAPLIISQVIGMSLLFRLAEFTCILLSYWRLGCLLEERKKDFISNTERALARDLPTVLKKWLQESGFKFLAPILLPIQLFYFLVAYTGTLFSDFDWYRSLSARWFWLRTRYQMDLAEAEAAEKKVNPDLLRYYDNCEVDGQHLPFIDTGLTRTINKYVDHWMNDRLSENTLMVTGEKGSGKSWALDEISELSVKNHPELRIIHQQINGKFYKTKDVRNYIGKLLDIDLSESLLALSEYDKTAQPTLIMLDKCQNLFLSKIGGLDGWKELIDITNTQLENVFWIFCMNNHSWAYLGNVFGKQYQIRNIITVKKWSQNDIRSLILSRTHISGYKIQYDENLLTSYGQDQNTGRSAEQRFFSLLWDSCNGNPLIALSMWKTAISTRNKEIIVGLPDIPSSSNLQKIGNDLLFVYRAIVTHENLAIDEIIQITNQPQNIIRYALKTGIDMEFLEVDNDQRYRVNPVWYQAVIFFLARKNMIHE